MDFFNYIKTNKIYLIIISIIINILLCILSIYLIFNKEECICNTPVVNNNEEEKEIDDFYVEVKGAVKKPGVYKLNSSNIINDLINISGGFTKNAYSKNINLSKTVSKELVVYVYTTNEYKKLNESKIVYITKEIPCECSSYDISNCIDNSKSEIISSDKDTIFEEDNINEDKPSLININTATLDELQTLSGIGLSKAKDIIEYRNKNGLFKDISEITNVSGIGNSIYEKIKDSITI